MVTTSVYDVRGRVTQRSGQPYTPPGGTALTPTESWTYDDVGNVLSTVDQLGAWAFAAYDDLDRVWATTATERSPSATFTTYTDHNDAGDVTRIVTPVNTASGASQTAVYNEAGDLVESRDEANNLTTYGYDLAGHVTSISHPQGSQTYTYNDRGLVTGGSGNGGTTTFTYDANGRMISRGDPGSYSTFGYNNRGDLTVVGGTTTGGSRSLAYDAARQLTSIRYGSGGATRTFGYDDLGRTTSDTLAGPGGTLRGQSYTYDAEDNELSTTVSPATVAGAGTSTYTYDRADRLTSWTDPASTTTSYGWDPAGNRTAVNGVAATYDQRNRLLSDGTATYSYTARGTLATRVAGSTTTTTEFDALDQLVSDSTSALTSYGYDGLGRLAVRNGTRLVYGGLEREPVTDGTSAYSRDPDGDIIATGTSGGNWATLTNTHGDLVAAFPTNGSSLTDNRAYDPFGSPIVAGAANLRVGYQGSWTDPTTARVSAQARWYTPGTGSFASRDTADVPFTGAASANRYLYGNANPLAYNDPTGYFGLGSITHAISGAAKASLAVATRAATSELAATIAADTLLVAEDAAIAGAVVASSPVSVPGLLGAAAVAAVGTAAIYGYQHLGSSSSPAARPAATPAPAARTPSAAAAAIPAPASAPATLAAPAYTPATGAGTVAGSAPRSGGGLTGGVPAATTTAAGTTGRSGVGGGAPTAAATAQNIQGITATRLDLHSPGENLPQHQARANSASGGPGLSVPDPNAGYHFVVPQCGPPLRCIGDPPPTAAARPAAPAAGGRPAAAAQAAEPASPDLFENPCDSSGTGVAPLASSCRPVTPDQTCWQAGNRYTDRYDDTQARICAQGGTGAASAGSAGGSLESCTPNSFDGDTAVLMADGTRKRIRDVRVGDRVLATDPVTGRTEARTVTALIVGQGLKHLVAVSVGTGHGMATLTATDHHPFWDDVDHAWVDADDLTSADELRTPTGSHLPVTATREYDRTQTVYNLTVDTLHTYYVLAGQTPVLVHNAKVKVADRVAALGVQHLGIQYPGAPVDRRRGGRLGNPDETQPAVEEGVQVCRDLRRARQLPVDRHRRRRDQQGAR